MLSLEERHAQREKHRKEGPEPVVIEKDPVDPNAPADDFELNEREPMRNKAPGSSREPPFFEAKVVGDDSIAGSAERVLTTADDAAAAKASTTAAKTSGGAGKGNGGGADWKAPK